MKQKQNRSSYKIVGVSDSFLAIVDLDQGKSVTNDAENVVAELLENFPDREIAYRDTTGTWAWIKHTGTPGSFSGFEPMDSGAAALLVEGIASEGLRRLNKPGLDAAPREIQEHLAGKVAPNLR